MKYQVWFRQNQDGRAPEVVFLEDYKWAGEMTADSPKDLVMQIATMDDKDSELLDHRQVTIGDVLQDETGKSLIFTPSGVWSIIEVFSDSEETA